MTDEEFFSWLDGEMDAGKAAEMEARVAASPELSARAAEHRQLASGLQAAFAPVIGADVPPPSFQSAEIVDFGARATGREPRRSPFGLPQWAAMAATLALGLVLGNFASRGDYSPVAVRGDHLVAAASLDRSLTTALAGTPTEGVRIGLTFRDAKGSICRSFDDRSASGLACFDRNQWRIEGLFPAAEGQFSDYRMAAGQDPRLAGLIGSKISGEAFDASQEQAARDRGWR